MLIAIVVIAVGFFFGISKLEWLIIILVIGMVISAEIFNTSIEILTDLVSPEENKKAGRVKDLAAGAVLVSAIAAVVLGLLIFLPKILSL